MGQLLGKEWQPRDLAEMCYNQGWTESMELVTCIAVCLSESQGFQRAVNDNMVEVQNFNVNEVGVEPTDYIKVKVLNPDTGKCENEKGEELRLGLDTKLIRSRDCGLFQINIPATAIGTVEMERLFAEPEYNIQRAWMLYERRGFQPWYAYTKHVYLRDTYIKRAARGVGNFMADRLLKRTPTDTYGGAPYEHKLTSPILDYQYRTALLAGGLARCITLLRNIKPLTPYAVDVKIDEVIKVATTARNEAKK